MGAVELLAPAGNLASLHAAVGAGADAVYLGLESFNARRGADNFTVEALSEACDCAHLRGVSVYVAMNTMVLPREIDEALEYVRQAYRAGADAFIVQDLGLAAEMSRTLPEARLHISTQMNVHNEAGIRAAARLGASRVTLARELSMLEIAHLASVAAEWGLEVEAFAHGALCVCYSGQCFMSSLIGGRSANRGTCAQACRLPYELHNVALRNKQLPSPGDHLLSPQDLCAVDLLPELVEAGVSSLKIEGRMKSPSYVASTTRIYRDVLDRALAFAERADASADDGAACARGESPARSARATSAQRDELAATFSRGFTTAYLEGRRGNDIMSYQRPNNRGQFVGRVEKADGAVAVVSSKFDLAAGDVIEFWTKKGRESLTVAKAAPVERGRVSVPLEGARVRSVRADDRVFRIRSAEAVYVDDGMLPCIPLVGHVTMRIGTPLEMTFSVAPLKKEAGSSGVLSAEWHGARRLAALFTGEKPMGMAQGEVVEAARTKAVTADDVHAHVDRLGSTPFVLERLDVELDEGVGIGFSQIHRCRAAALEDLADKLLDGRRERVLPRVEARPSTSERPPERCIVAALATNPTCARAAKKAGAHVVYVPALNFARGEATIAGQLASTVERGGYPEGCVPVMPVADHDSVGEAREAKVDFDVWRCVREGDAVLAESLAGLQRAIEEGAAVEAGPHIPVTNRLSLQVLRDFGVRRAWLSPELTLKQIGDLGAASPVGLGLTVVGTQELMTTEHCMLMSQGPCDEKCSTCPRRKSPHYLKDRKGFEFPVVTDLFGRSHLYNSVQLDIVPFVPDLISSGVTAFMVDTTLMNGEEASQATARAVRAVKVAQADGNSLAKAPGTTSGHLHRGVS